MKQDHFSGYHPIINFLYFVLVIGCAMFLMHPVFLCLTWLGGMSYLAYLRRGKVKAAFALSLPVFLISALMNPAFNHEGATILFYLRSGNPMTLESILYGLAFGVMLVSVLNWFSCYQAVMTSDKFIYLFGKALPAMSLILSMVFRFVPKFKNQIEKVSDAQKCIGRDVTNGNALARARHGMKILSIMTTWSLENSVETADSMKSRGYGLRGRNNFSIYRFDSRDRLLLAVLAVIGSVVLGAVLTRQVSFLYYPLLKMNAATPGAVLAYVFYGGLCLLPTILNLTEDIKWHYLKSKI